MYKYLGLLLITILASACSQNRDSEGSRRINSVPIAVFQPKDSLALDLYKSVKIDLGDSGTFYSPATKVYEQNGQSYLVNYNYNFHAINFIDWQEKKVTRIVPLLAEGPNGITKGFDDFYYHNKDSIFFIYYNGGMVKLGSEDNSKPVKTFRIDGSQSIPNYNGTGFEIAVNVALGNNVYYRPARNSIVCLLLPQIVAEYIEYYDYPALGVYNLSSEKMTHTFGDFPDVYRKEHFYARVYEPSVAYLEDGYLVNFGIARDIMQYDLEGKLMKRVVNEVPYIPAQPTHGLPRNLPDLQEQINFETQAAMYLRILPDPYRNVFYRIFKYEQDLKDIDGKLNPRFQGRWGIEILNENLQIVGRKDFDKDTPYFYFVSFVNEEGLCIAEKQGRDEEQVSVAVFKPQLKTNN